MSSCLLDRLLGCQHVVLILTLSNDLSCMVITKVDKVYNQTVR